MVVSSNTCDFAEQLKLQIETTRKTKMPHIGVEAENNRFMKVKFAIGWCRSLILYETCNYDFQKKMFEIC